MGILSRKKKKMFRQSTGLGNCMAGLGSKHQSLVNPMGLCPQRQAGIRVEGLKPVNKFATNPFELSTVLKRQRKSIASKEKSDAPKRRAFVK